MATINGIEQGISCYSYTEQFIKNDDWTIDTVFAHVAAQGVTKVELVGAQTFQQYPVPREEEIQVVLEASRKHGVEVFSYGGYVDLGRVTGRAMSREDILSDIRLDIMTARRLGARLLRATGFGPDMAEAVNAIGEEYGIRIGFEIHVGLGAAARERVRPAGGAVRPRFPAVAPNRALAPSPPLVEFAGF